MKIKTGLLFFLTVSVLMSACVGTKALGVLDDGIPQEQRSHLEIRNSLSVVAFNNQPVDWTPGIFQNKVTVELPPGRHSIEVKYTEQVTAGGVTVKTTKTATISEEFLAGHSYQIYLQKSGTGPFSIMGFSINLASVRIRDVTPGRN